MDVAGMLKEMLPCQQALRAVPAPAPEPVTQPEDRNICHHSSEEFSSKKNLQVKEVLKFVRGMSRTTKAQGHQHPALSLPEDGQTYLCPFVLPEKDMGHLHQKDSWPRWAGTITQPCSPREAAELRRSLLHCPASQQLQPGSTKSESQAATEGRGLSVGFE